MKAVRLRGHGGFEQLEYRADVAVPAPGPGEVLVRIAAAAINNTDINTRIGWYDQSISAATADVSTPPPDARGWRGSPAVFPRIQGADACGRLVGAGTRVLIDPVLASEMGAGAPPRYFGSDCDGAFAEYACVPAANAQRIDSTLSDIELAALPCAYGAAETMLTRLALRSGETLLIRGASGGVGSAAVQLARLRGARIIAVCSADKGEALRALGAEQIIERDADLLAALGAESVDALIDVVGGPGASGALNILRRRGRYATAGAIAGPAVTLDWRTLYLKDLTLYGCTVPDPGVFTRLLQYVERGELVPPVAAVYPLSRIIEAQEAFLAKRHVGKIVLLPGA